MYIPESREDDLTLRDGFFCAGGIEVGTEFCIIIWNEFGTNLTC